MDLLPQSRTHITTNPSSPRRSMDLLPQSRTHITTNPNRAASIDSIRAPQAINANSRQLESTPRSFQVTRQALRRSFISDPVLTGTDNSDDTNEWQSLDHLITNPSIQCMQALERLNPGKHGWTENQSEHITPQFCSQNHSCLLGESTNMPLAPVIISRRKSNGQRFF